MFIHFQTYVEVRRFSIAGGGSSQTYKERKSVDILANLWSNKIARTTSITNLKIRRRIHDKPITSNNSSKLRAILDTRENRIGHQLTVRAKLHTTQAIPFSLIQERASCKLMASPSSWTSWSPPFSYSMSSHIQQEWNSFLFHKPSFP